jgi:hypothetical protein
MVTVRRPFVMVSQLGPAIDVRTTFRPKNVPF